MTLHVAIKLGLTNLNLPSIQKELARRASERRFLIQREPLKSLSIPDYHDGHLEAEGLATALAMHCYARLYVGVVMVRYTPRHLEFSSARLDLAVFIVNGELLKKPIELTPQTTKRECLGFRPSETHFNSEACNTLAEAVRIRQRTLNLL